MFFTTSFADIKKFKNTFPFTLDILIAIPQIIENTSNAITLSFDNNLEKSFTVNS